MRSRLELFSYLSCMQSLCCSSLDSKGTTGYTCIGGSKGLKPVSLWVNVFVLLHSRVKIGMYATVFNWFCSHFLCGTKCGKVLTKPTTWQIPIQVNSFTVAHFMKCAFWIPHYPTKIICLLRIFFLKVSSLCGAGYCGQFLSYAYH